MPLPTAPLVIGTHAFFFREGDAFALPAPGTAGRNAKPGATDAGWIDLGVISESSDMPEQEEVEVFAPSPGQKRLYDVIPVKNELTLKFTLEELSPLAIELLYKTLNLDAASAQFNPLEGKPKKGWLKVQRYGQDDLQKVVMDLFVYLKVGGEVDFSGDEISKVSLEARVLHSTLNTGTL